MIPNSLAGFIGLRYVRSRQEEGFFSLISIFSFAAMTLGVAALIIVLSVMNGFDREIKLRILNVVPHLTLKYPNDFDSWQQDLTFVRQVGNVVAANTFVEGQGMLSARGHLQGVSVQGIDPEQADLYSAVADNMKIGQLNLLKPGEYGVILGALLARSLQVVTGDQVLLTLPQVTITPAGIFPRVKTLRVVGVFEVGAQVDSGIALIHLSDAQKLYRYGDGYSGIRVRLSDAFSFDKSTAEIQGGLTTAPQIVSWPESMKTLFAAIKMEKTVVGLLLGVIIAVAGFNIVATLVLMVAGKRKDIAVLRAMGADSATISAIFRVQGAVSGLAGVIIGAVAGSLIAWQLGDIVALLEQVSGLQIFDPNVYFISQLPTDLRLPDVVIVTLFGAIISVLATLYPAYRAGQISPAEVLRYEH
jgi:lipoprotein-releasing system permease protein